MLRRLTAALVPAAVLAAAWASPPAAAQDDAGAFSDDDGAYYEAPFDALDEAGILEGTECAAGRICPDEPIKRSTMAIWLGRGLTDAEPDPVSSTRFADVDAAHPQAAHIERFAELGITKGCATDPLRYCPDDHVTRGQMAAFLVRAFDLPDADPAGFTDTAGHLFEDQINTLAAAGITKGCATDPLRYCPSDTVSRGQMATFIARALNLVPEDPTPSFAINPAMEGGGIIAADGRTQCAITTDRTVQCWTEWRWEPGTTPEAPQGEFTAVAMGTNSPECGIRTDQTIQCWGNTDYWNPATGESFRWDDIPEGGITVVPDESGNLWFGFEWDIPEGEFTTLWMGYGNACGIRTDQTIRCWGNTAYNSKYPASFSTASESVEWQIPEGEFTTLSLRAGAACGIRTDRTIQCWGDTAIIYYDPDAREYVRIEWDVPQGEFTAVSLGSGAACGIRTDRTIQCWGNTSSSFWLGPGESVDVEWDVPQGEFTAVSLGGGAACGISADQTIQCWGDTSYILWDDGERVDVEWDVPQGEFTAVSLGGGAACGISADQTIRCWDTIGGGSVEDLVESHTPEGRFAVVVAASAVEPAADSLVAFPYMCGIRIDGSATCWDADGPWDQYTPAGRFGPG